MSNIGNHTTIGYKFFALDGITNLTISARGSFKGKVEVSTQIDRKLIAFIPLELMSAWNSSAAQFTVPQGTYPIYLRFVGKGKADLLEYTLETL